MIAAQEVISLTKLSTNGLEYIGRNSGYSQLKLMYSEFKGLNIDCKFVYHAQYMDSEGQFRICRILVSSVSGSMRTLCIEEA
jgi:hypothetical protein